MWNEDRAQAARWAEGPARVRPPWMRVDTPRPGHTWELPPGFTPCARPGAAGGRDAPRHVTPREAGIREGLVPHARPRSRGAGRRARLHAQRPAGVRAEDRGACGHFHPHGSAKD